MKHEVLGGVLQDPIFIKLLYIIGVMYDPIWYFM